ncbi:hypothetical protein MJD09_23160, partial [bacterium]|nr:hypothetical protein [bacterium]
IRANSMTINQVHIAANKDRLYVLYRFLPILKIISLEDNNIKDAKEVHFTGEVVNSLYKAPTGIRTNSSAKLAKIFAWKIAIGLDGLVYWLCFAGKEHGKVFVFDLSLENRRAYSIESPDDASGHIYSDFCLGNKSIYVCNAATGNIEVYQN